ncbi:MAG: phospholipid-binding protein MlaC [Gammaproteobacteria bacterium]|tara:strand:+ start:1686 stop:2300 length:615 start_codon:yes stop_codon:yes gene_type:complete
MLPRLKSYFLSIFILAISLDALSEINPHEFIDGKAQEMVNVLKKNNELFYSDKDAYENKIKVIFEPIIDFRRVSALVMGKKYYVASSKEQRRQFIEVFKDSLLDTYSETLAQWQDQNIITVFPENYKYEKQVNVKQNLYTSSSVYPIKYTLRRDGDEWKIINIVVNGVNLGLTFRNQFRALADSNNGDMDLTIASWVSDAGFDE